jgi:O-acetyl-ADP-ribose deacetylase (regulator of RNase III)
MKYISGDLIQLAKEGKFDVIVHGCNCFNTMGSGIAKQIKENYPVAWEVDQSTEKGGRHKLGKFTMAMYDPIVINAYIQYDYGRDGKDRFEYEAFEMILDKLWLRYPNARFGFPYIGCGLAGGDEAKIVDMLKDFDRKIRFYGGSVTLVKYE